ncbi:unnamed protein product, partial [Closterium sp. Naga37s-1]
ALQLPAVPALNPLLASLPPPFPTALPSEIEEAMCQVMAHLWLQRYQQQLKSPSPFQSGFLEFCLTRVASDPSPALLDSFRSAYSAVVFKGLLATIQTLRMSNTLPAI